MDTFGINELRRLAEQEGGPCLTVYLSTHVSGEQEPEDRVRLKNLMQAAEEQLADGWLRSADARDLVAAARKLVTDPEFWASRSQGLALFVAPGVHDAYRLPLAFEEFVTVHDRFHLKPLLPWLNADYRFLVLTFSQDKVRLFTVTQHAIEQVDVPGLPANMEGALNYSGADRGSQVHSAMKGDLGKQAGVFHGQGGQSDTHKDDLAQYFRLIDTALQPVARDQGVPLLLAGVEYLLPIYRQVSQCSHLVDMEMNGNCDYLSPHEIAERARQLMVPPFQQDRREAVERYGRLSGTARVSDDLSAIVPAAQEGRIDTLFVDIRATQWGTFEPQSVSLEIHASRQSGDDDLLDLAAVQTLLHGGKTYAVERDELPSREPISAVFRY